MKYTSIAVMALLGNVSAKQLNNYRSDSYDKDPETTSVYDDLHTYVPLGSAKFDKPAPAAPAKAAPVA